MIFRCWHHLNQPDSLESPEVEGQAAWDWTRQSGFRHSAGGERTPCCRSHAGQKQHHRRRGTHHWKQERGGLKVWFFIEVLSGDSKDYWSQISWTVRCLIYRPDWHHFDPAGCDDDWPHQVSDCGLKLQQEDLPALLQQTADRLGAAGVRQTFNLSLQLLQLCSCAKSHTCDVMTVTYCQHAVL